MTSCIAGALLAVRTLSPVFLCDGQWHGADRVLSPTQVSYVRAIQTWMGIDRDVVADADVWVLRDDGMPLEQLQWDHYAEPTGLSENQRWHSFAPDYVTLEAGHHITVMGRCFHYAGSGQNGQVATTIWYLESQP